MITLKIYPREFTLSQQVFFFSFICFIFLHIRE